MRSGTDAGAHGEHQRLDVHRPSTGSRGRLRRPRTRWFWTRIGAVAVIAFGIRLLYLAFVTEHFQYGFDAVWYELQGGFIKLGLGYIDPVSFFRGVPQSTANWPPLYPLLLAGADEVHRSQLTVQLVGSATGSVLVVLVGMLGRSRRRARAGPRRGGGRRVVPAPDRRRSVHDGRQLVCRPCDCSRCRDLLGPRSAVGASLGVPRHSAGSSRAHVGRRLHLRRGAVIPSAAFARTVSGRRRLGLAAIVLVCCVAVNVPWWLRNESALGNPMVAPTNSSTTLAGANCDATYSFPSIGLWDVGMRRDGTIRSSRRSQVRTGRAFRAELRNTPPHPTSRRGGSPRPARLRALGPCRPSPCGTG